MALLQLDNLQIEFPMANGKIFSAVDGISFEMDVGESLAFVGESGSGKSLTSLAITKLLPEHAVVRGSIIFQGENIFSLKESQLRRTRGGEICYVFQESMGCLNPLLTIGFQLRESIQLHRKNCSRRSANVIALQHLRRINFADPEKVLRSYPHQLSGGMLQRVAIAMAICNGPKLLIADEPTAALDSHSQRVVLNLLAQLRALYGFSLLIITHNLGVAMEMAERVAVMHRGRIVEIGQCREVFSRPAHGHTCRLIQSIPRLPRG
ncbi:MAG: ABC transporter ATP-binding protein [Puniceicoccales bacterium]|jgi:ABC-type dipeptide/oligopeptide/nickel transport system ATPase component|nr:ABC transporter ATP-binding protein [Puniceicoccales bacterium]